MRRGLIPSRGLAAGIVLAASAASVQAGAFYAGVSADGRLRVADEPGSGLLAFQPSTLRKAAGRPREGIVDASRWQPLLQQIAAEVGIEPALLQAVVQQESAFNPLAVSPAGAAGLMQLMPATAARFGVRDRFDPVQNLRGGARYLAWLLHHFDQDLDLALAGYNAGEGSVRRHGNRIPPFVETQAYVRAVRQHYAR